MNPSKMADAVAHMQRGDYAGAQRLCKQILRRESNNAAVLHLLGVTLLSAGDAAQAVMMLNRALLYAPDQAEIHLSLANALAARDQVDQAVEVLTAMLARWPQHVDALYNRAVLLQRLRRFEAASSAYGEVLRADPAHVDAYNNRGIVLESLGQFDAAEASYREALEFRPDHVQALNNLGKLFKTQGALEAAARHCLRAIELQPDFVDAHLNLGSVRALQGDSDAALEHYRQALTLAPEDADVHTAYGMLCLSLGQFAVGWRSYQWRPQRRAAQAQGFAFDQQLPAAIGGKRIVLVGEQGLGDELFFLRYAPLLKQRGALLVGFCDGKIAQPLLRTGLFEAMHAQGSTLPAGDLRFMIGDLPWVTGNAPTLPAPLRLTALDARVAVMHERLKACGPAPYFGLTWRAGTPPQEQIGRVDRALFKQAPVAQLRDVLASSPGTLIGLQRLPHAGEINEVSALLARTVHDFSAVNDDIEDMLALLSLLHEYVGVSNTNMHLLAGLGGSARVLVPHPPEWRWMMAGDVSPWFPGFKVYRQAKDGDWREALRALGVDLAQAHAP